MPQICVAPGTIPERLEGDRHLDRPALGEASRFDIPDRVPVAVRIALVCDLRVVERPEGICLEEKAVSAIVERVQDDGEAGAAELDVPVVAPHLVGNDAFRVRFPEPRGKIDVRLVVEDPHLGLLGRRSPFQRFLLNETVNGRGRRIGAFFEAPIDVERFVQANGAQCGTPSLVARQDLRILRRRRPVDPESWCGVGSRPCLWKERDDGWRGCHRLRW